ncbi:DNA mismatch repair endonuclease MutL [Robiginitalea sp. M366]|uniref:DNA mismatch repair endonuclease MutL n=1 Tax=Robiginitalea aestuariiviva TaxID=3036903 RepID=UPI00240D8A7C|nr:DNA mismatch repair endonuclease MutL [Robiginitalea aestuariiviva]MDG1573247.1 DNA mismatch repair endonuclease MutL [Robiginitalea aestuariiviva]
MPNRIHVLPDHVANQIAAGEVVQRPASAVKELLENAIDAGSTQIELIIKDGGKTLIQVVDNGSGMSGEDALLCFRRHATSKISGAEDLFRIRTKGFRGEALASIAAIAQVELTTRTADARLATRIRIAGDQVQAREEAVAPEGTSLSVKNLFFNIPARRNFLKSAKVEFRHVLEEFQRVALAHPGVGFRMIHNESEVHHLPASKLRQRIDYLFGNRMHDRLVPITEETQLAAIGGFVVKPEFAKKSRGEQYFFVNDRFIKSPYLHHAVMAAFEGLLKPDTVPGYFLYLDVPPESLDVNIHPTKTEVKFEDEQSLYAILRSAVKHSLGQFSIRPVLDFERDQNLDTPYAFREREVVVPEVSVDRNFNPFSEPQARGGVAPRRNARPAAGWEALYEGLGETPAGEPAQESLEIESGARGGGLLEEGDTLHQDVRGVFQLDRRYIVTRIKSGLLLIDQQRAHQRVLYEQLLENITRQDPVVQTLIFPLVISLNPAERHLLEDLTDALEGMGFRFRLAENGPLEIIGLPALVPEAEAPALVDGLLAGWQQHAGEEGFSQSDRMAKALCKRLAVKPGTALEPSAQLALVNDLFGCRDARMSPFQKPIHMTLPLEELDQKLNTHG